MVLSKEEWSFWFNLFIKKPGCVKYFSVWKKYKNGQNFDPLLVGIPWLTFEAIDWLDKYLRKYMKVFEWGSGGSTIYLSKKSGTVWSIEHDPAWHKKVKRFFLRRKLKNIHYYLVKPRKDIKLNTTKYKSTDEVFKKFNFKNYSQKIDAFPDGYFDLVIVDGRARNSCIAEALDKVKNGGYLVLDNSERKEYSSGIKLLKKWKRNDFFGPGPYNIYFWKTSIFQKQS